MRTIILAALALPLFAVEGQAQVIGAYQTQVEPVPYYFGPPVYGQSTFTSPYGYRTFSNYGIQYGYYGPQAYRATGTAVRPYSVGPFHSVYFDPFANTYRYTTGYGNTPTYRYRISGYPY